MNIPKALVNALSLLCVLSMAAACATPTAAPTRPAALPTTAPDQPTPGSAATSAPATEAVEPVTLTFLVDDSQNTVDTTHAVADAYMALHPNVTIEIENRPQGGDGDNVVKTRLATGEMTDLFFYNSGSLFQALHPEDTLVDLTNEPFVANVVESFLPTVTQNGKVFGVPLGTAAGGGILYNKKIYADLGLSVPATWAEFEANNEAIKAAGIAPVIATYDGTSTWTSQLFVLADYYNVEQAHPTFAADYTANQAKYATIPEAMAGFAYLREAFDKDWYQQGYATTTFEQGLKLLADGDGAHYPMLSFALGTIQANWPEAANNIGFFGVPGTDASNAGATIWMPAGVYIPQTSEHIEEAKAFLAFLTTVDAIDAINAKVPPVGPYLIKGTSLPEEVLPGVKDIETFISAGNTAPALEFLSPIKGPSLEQICIAVGTGQMTPEEAAAAYDEDVVKQAQQLGLPGW